MPADGDYILEVFAYSGISKYVLQILPASNSLLPTASESQPARPSFKPGEAIVQWKDTADTSAITAFNVREHRAQAMSTATDRPVKLNLRKPASVERLSASTGQDLSAFTLSTPNLTTSVMPQPHRMMACIAYSFTTRIYVFRKLGTFPQALLL